MSLEIDQKSVVFPALVAPEHFFIIVLVLNLAEDHLSFQSPRDSRDCVIVLKFLSIIEAVICEDNFEVFVFV